MLHHGRVAAPCYRRRAPSPHADGRSRTRTTTLRRSRCSIPTASTRRTTRSPAASEPRGYTHVRRAVRRDADRAVQARSAGDHAGAPVLGGHATACRCRPRASTRPAARGTGRQRSTGDPRYPYGARRRLPFDATTCGATIAIPNTYTGRFDGIGAFVDAEQHRCFTRRCRRTSTSASRWSGTSRTSSTAASAARRFRGRSRTRAVTCDPGAAAVRRSATLQSRRQRAAVPAVPRTIRPSPDTRSTCTSRLGSRSRPRVRLNETERPPLRPGPLFFVPLLGGWLGAAAGRGPPAARSLRASMRSGRCRSVALALPALRSSVSTAGDPRPVAAPPGDAADLRGDPRDDWVARVASLARGGRRFARVGALGRRRPRGSGRVVAGCRGASPRGARG